MLNSETGLISAAGVELFYQGFSALKSIFGEGINGEFLFSDILKVVFNDDGNADEPRLRLESIRQIPGEIGLRVGAYGQYFGVINIGDTSGLLKDCERKGIIVNTEEFVSDSLFESINKTDSIINILIGSRKFTEGWNCWRVSTMGLINFAKGEGSQAIQLFGRGVRLKGYNGTLKRTKKLSSNTTPPQFIELLETLTIFGVKANYMEAFKNYLEQEEVPVNEVVQEYRLPVISRYNEIKDKKLHIIRVKNNAVFKKHSARLLLNKPSPAFAAYLNKNKIIIDCRSKIQTIESTFSFKVEVFPEPQVLPQEVLPLLNYQRIYEELVYYKAEKKYYNICISINHLIEILQSDGWYGLLIPNSYLKIHSLSELELATDYAIMILKSYMDKFFKFEKEKWESNRLEYSVLEASDSNLISEYTLTYSPQNSLDTTGSELQDFVIEITNIMKANAGLNSYKQKALQKSLIMFDLKEHLYAPLVCLEKSNYKIQVAPVALNHDEMQFVDYLNDYIDKNRDYLIDKSLYLLRNKSKAGIGFFEAGNFYPDFILWINTADTQYISFIDPKGLLHISVDDPKIQFYKTIKELEVRLQSTVNDERIVLNSFIMSGTPASDLKMWWSTESVVADRPFREKRNVYTLDNPTCVESMINKILET